jgi:arginine N-succinyltransferase
MTAPDFRLQAQALHEHALQLTVLDAGGELLVGAVLRPRIGLRLPRFWYHVGQVVHAARELQLFRAQRTLLLGNDLTGQAELGDFVAADAEPERLQAAWIVLASDALQRVASEPGHWGPGLIAELPGLRDAQGQSPFWEGLTRHFYRGDAAEAAARLGPEWRTHLAALLPRQMVYASFLPDAAQQAVGGHEASVAPLVAALLATGMRWQGHVRIDDAGVVLEAGVAGLGQALATRASATG